MAEAAEKIEPEVTETPETPETLDDVDNYFDIDRGDQPEPEAEEDDEEAEDEAEAIDDEAETDDEDEYSFLSIEDPKKRRAIGKRLLEKAKREAAENAAKLKDIERKLEERESVDRIADKLGLKKPEEKESLDDKLVRLGKATGEEIDLDDFMSDAEKRAVALSLENKLHSQRAQEREVISEITGTISGFIDQQKQAGKAEMAGMVEQCYNAALKSEMVAIRRSNPGLDARTMQAEAERSLVGKAYQLAGKQGGNVDPATVILQYGAEILDELGVPTSPASQKPAKQAPLIDKRAREDVMERAGSPAVQVDNSGTPAERKAQEVRKKYENARKLFDEKA